MKKILLAALLFAAAGIVNANAQSQNFRAPVNNRDRVQQRRAAVPREPRAVGAFVRTARNPIQLINPRAPRRYYGPPEETIVFDPVSYEASQKPRITGLILFGLAW